jgi:hypothetical protein
MVDPRSNQYFNANKFFVVYLIAGEEKKKKKKKIKIDRCRLGFSSFSFSFQIVVIWPLCVM